MRLDPEIIRQQIASLIAACPELAEDDVLRADMIEGETDAFAFLSSLARKIGETGASIDSLQAYRRDLCSREDRLHHREGALRSLAFQIMQTADFRKVELPEATLSVRNGTPKVVITDERLLPDNCVRIRVEPDKTKIKELLATEYVPGAELSNAEPTLAIRVK